jgi:hypothetical protein
LITPKYDVSLGRDALLGSVRSSTALEGNPLFFREVIALA